MRRGRLVEPMSPVSAVETRLITDRSTGQFHFQHHQDVEPVMDAVKAIPDIYPRQQKGRMGRLLGTVPCVLLQEWAKEWGLQMFSREFNKKVKQRLLDSEYNKFRVDWK